MVQVNQGKKVCIIMDEPTLTMLERLQRYYGFKNKSDVIRMAIARLYEELVAKKVLGG